jgi:glycerate dehydrogenase
MTARHDCALDYVRKIATLYFLKIIVLDGHTLNPGDQSWGGLERLGKLTVYDRTGEDELIARASGAEILLTNKVPLRAEVIGMLPGLRYIGVTATGYNIVDVAAASELGMVVTNVPSYGTASVAQHTLALLLELTNQTGLHAAAVQAGEWSRSPDWSFWKTPLMELSGKTLGVVGFGQIGRKFAGICHAMGMRILATPSRSSSAPDWPGFRWMPLDELLPEADVVSLHCPLTEQSRDMINRRTLARMKKTAFLINTARGGLVAEQDLADALNQNRIAGAALDVLPEEPPVSGSPLFTAKNCMITPHVAWAKAEARARLLEIAVANVAAFLGGNPTNIVNR